MTDVYDMYGPQRSGRRNRLPEYIEEDEEYESEGDSAADMQFEMMPPTYASRSMSSKRSSRGKSVQSFRVKVHALDDIRYIMITRDTSFGELEGKIREKFNFRNRLRIRMRDDGDMITMGDQDDLEMVIMTVKQAARKQRQEIGKMEVSLYNVDVPMIGNNANMHIRFGSRKSRRHVLLYGLVIQFQRYPALRI